MKKSFFATLALTAAIASAQAQAPAPTQAPAQAPAKTQAQAPAQPKPAVADSLAKVTADSTAKSAPAAATTAPAKDSTVAAPTDSLASVQSAAVQDSATTAAVDSATVAAADSTVASDSAKVDSTVAAVPDTTTPPVSYLEGTEISGEIQGFIKADNSPYLVVEDLTVEPNTAVIIEPGVVFLFMPNTGIHSEGQFIVAGSRANTVIFRSASSSPKPGDWKGITITGETSSEIRNANIRDAVAGIAVENSNLSLQSTNVSNSLSRGLFARNSKVTVTDGSFENNKGAAIHADSYTELSVKQVNFSGNQVALYNSPMSITDVESSLLENNDYGILDMGNSFLAFSNSRISKNKTGASADEVLDKSIIESVSGNETEFNRDFKTVASLLPPNPEIPGVESRPLNQNDKIGDWLSQKSADEQKNDTTAKTWSIIGSVMLGVNYHNVTTLKNKTDSLIVVSGDSIKPGKHYENTFQVPGLGAEASAYLLMRSSDGKTIEFNTDLTADSWNHFSPNPVTLSYSDNHNYAVLGDFTKMDGDIYMSSLQLFGAGYRLSLLKNNANQPLFELDGFFGEARKPYLLGERHPYIYNNYIEEGEAQAQRIAYGAAFKWAPLRRFDAKFGFVYADDELKDPLLRDGSSKTNSTSEPLQQSMTLYADGNWLFYPGDIELRGQIAVGRSDTTDVVRERAINKVFTDAGLNVSSLSKMRELMNNEAKISSLNLNELEAIFGENTTLTRGQMRDSLRTLIREAKVVKGDYESDRDDSRVLGLNWGSQNFAIGASLYWNIYKTTISGSIKYVGEDFYSAGSANQLADTREFHGKIEQIITNFWTLNGGYELDIENAANGGETNLFGLGEGTRWGLFSDSDSKWAEEHELDKGRTKYIQNWRLGSSFKIGSNVNLDVGYNLEYRTQYRPYQLHGDYILEDGIYRDGWFAARKNRSTTEIVDKDRGDTTEVDSARWAEYMRLSSEEYLASKFQERIYRNTWKLDVSLQAFKTLFKVGGRWTVRTDDSKFYKDEPIDGINLADETWAKMGYYFGGANYFEHSYPLSATTKLKRIQNYVSVQPRFKTYKRDDMKESEITIDDEFEISFLNRFLIWGISGEFRYLTVDWEEEDVSMDESETDILASTNLRVNHTKRLYSEWYVGSALYLRPDNESSEYTDIFGGVRVNYQF